MKAIVLFLSFALLAACTGKKKEYKEPTGIRVTRQPDGRIVSVPDSSRRDSM